MNIIDMNILHICNGFTTSKLYEELISRLNEFGLHQTVIAPSFIPYDHSTNLNSNINLHVLRRENSFFQRCCFSRKIRNITSYIENLGVSHYNIIHAHTLFSDGMVAYKLYIRYGIPYVVAIRNSDINFFFRYFIHKRSLAYKILLNAKLIICISPIYVQRLEENVPKKVFDCIKNNIAIIPNGINSQWIYSRHKEIKRIHFPIKLIFCGSIEKNKNIHSILSASEILNNEGITNEVIIIGKREFQNDNYLNAVERRLARAHGTIKERMGCTKLMKEYSVADIFVMPSFTETFGLVYAEALSQGLPIIYTKNEGFDGFFSNGEIGKAVVAGNIGDIVNGIKYIIHNYNTIQKRITTIDFEKFNWDKISRIYLKHYQTIVQN